MKNLSIVFIALITLAVVVSTTSTTSIVSANVATPIPNATPEERLDADAVSALIEELKDGLPDLIEDEAQVSAIIKKWDKRKDLEGKTRSEILKLIFADLKAVVKDKESQDNIWKSWTEEQIEVEAPVKTPQEPDPPVVRSPETPVAPIVKAETQNGSVKFFDDTKGFGFITPDGGGADILFYYSDINGRFKSLSERQRVTYELRIDSKGRRFAINVRLV